MNINKLIDTSRSKKGLFLKGIFAPIASIKYFLKEDGYRKYFILPIILTMILVIGIIFLTVTFLYPYISEMLSFSISTDTNFILVFILKSVKVLFGFLIFFLVSIIALFTYSILGGIVVIPFLDPLSVKIEKKLSNETFEEDFEFIPFLLDMLRIIKNSIFFIIFTIFIMIVLAIINFIPGIGNFLYMVLNFLNVAFFIAFTCLELSLDRRKLSLKEKLKIAWYFKFMLFGLGITMFILTMIPVLGFISWTVGVIGATILFVENIKPVLLIEDKS